MEMRCVWIIYIVLLTITIQKTTSVRLVVLREHPNSASEEDTSDALSEEESEEIDLLMDLIENEAKNRDQSAKTTVRVIKQIAEHRVPLVEQLQQAAQHSYRRERVESHPNSFREYHVHYHNHNHRGPIKPAMNFDDSLHPYAWSSQFPLRDFEVFKQLPKAPYVPFEEKPRKKEFKNLNNFFRTTVHPRTPFPSSDNVDQNVRLEAMKDYETFIKSRIPYKAKLSTPFERMKKFQEFYDSEEEKTTFTNKDRFADFKDFSELERDAEKARKEEKGSTQNLEKKTVKIKDFAIVIKTRPRKNQNQEIDIKENFDDQDESTGPQIPPFVNKLNVPYERLFGVPRIIDAAGGTPKYIDQLNQLKYPPQEFYNMPRPPFPLGGMENDPRKLHHLRGPFLPPPFPMPPHPMHFPYRNNMNGWLRRRLMRKK